MKDIFILVDPPKFCNGKPGRKSFPKNKRGGRLELPPCWQRAIYLDNLG